MPDNAYPDRRAGQAIGARINKMNPGRFSLLCTAIFLIWFHTAGAQGPGQIPDEFLVSLSPGATPGGLERRFQLAGYGTLEPGLPPGFTAS